MPAVSRYPTQANANELRAVEDAFSHERSERDRVIDAQWDYYNGNHRQPLKKDNTGTNDNLMINLISLLIDKGVSELLGVDDRGNVQGLKIDIVNQPGERGFMETAATFLAGLAGQQEEEIDPAQAFIDGTYEANRMNALLLNALTNAAVTGHGFLKLLPQGVEHPQTGEIVPRLVALNPKNCTVFWAEDDIERVLWYRVEYKRSRQDIVRVVNEDGTDAGYWQVIDMRRETDYGNWDTVSVTDWPFGWAPIVDWQNQPNPNGYYGKDDIGGTGRLNDGLNFLASNVQRILKHHAHPKTIGTGIKVEELQASAVGGLWTVMNENAKVYNLEMQSDLASSLNFMGVLRRAIFDGARELDPSSVQDKLGDLTNFGLRVLFNDNLAKSGVKRLSASYALSKLTRNLLELGGYDRAVKLNVTWPDPLPVDPVQEAQHLTMMSQMGLSQETALERAGYDPEQERQRRALTSMEQQRTQSAGRQAEIADRLRAGGGGVLVAPEGGPLE